MVLYRQMGYGWINSHGMWACFAVGDVAWWKAEAELLSLLPMFKARVDDVSDCMRYQQCGNPLCMRLVSRDMARDCERLWFREAKRGFGAGWCCVRRRLLAYGRRADDSRAPLQTVLEGCVL